MIHGVETCLRAQLIFSIKTKVGSGEGGGTNKRKHAAAGADNLKNANAQLSEKRRAVPTDTMQTKLKTSNTSCSLHYR